MRHWAVPEKVERKDNVTARKDVCLHRPILTGICAGCELENAARSALITAWDKILGI